MKTLNAGYLSAFLAYLFWGFLPLYWKPLSHIPAEVVLSYRIFFSFFTAWILEFIRLRLPAASSTPGPAQAAPGRPERGRLLRASLAAAALIGLNWFLYIWAVLNGRTLEASLGYFLTPLVNLLLGMLLMGERPGPYRLGAMGLGALALLILGIGYGAFPWVSLILAFTFGLYGYVKKNFTLGPFAGLGLESLWLMPFALWILLGSGGFSWLGSGSPTVTFMLVMAGPVTLAPLAFFAVAARNIPLYALGFFQYIAPSIMFIIGWLVFREEVGLLQFFAYGLVWCAIGIFIWTTLKHLKEARSIRRTLG